MMKCRTGTHRLTHDGRGAVWEDEIHTITWATEDNFEDALERQISLQIYPNRDILGVWVEQRN